MEEIRLVVISIITFLVGIIWGRQMKEFENNR